MYEHFFQVAKGLQAGLRHIYLFIYMGLSVFQSAMLYRTLFPCQGIPRGKIACGQMLRECVTQCGLSGRLWIDPLEIRTGMGQVIYSFQGNVLTGCLSFFRRLYIGNLLARWVCNY